MDRLLNIIMLLLGVNAHTRREYFKKRESKRRVRLYRKKYGMW